MLEVASVADRNMMLTPDEYMSLMRLIKSERESEGAVEEARVTRDQPKPRPRSARAKRSDKKLSKAFTEANEKLRTRKGQLRKGKTQADVARLAHRIKKKM